MSDDSCALTSAQFVAYSTLEFGLVLAIPAAQILFKNLFILYNMIKTLSDCLCQQIMDGLYLPPLFSCGFIAKQHLHSTYLVAV